MLNMFKRLLESFAGDAEQNTKVVTPARRCSWRAQRRSPSLGGSDTPTPTEQAPTWLVRPATDQRTPGPIC